MQHSSYTVCSDTSAEYCVLSYTDALTASKLTYLWWLKHIFCHDLGMSPKKKTTASGVITFHTPFHVSLLKSEVIKMCNWIKVARNIHTTRH